jgi:hypothetical protein
MMLQLMKEVSVKQTEEEGIAECIKPLTKFESGFKSLK